MQGTSVIGIDVECESCGYNLRGLSPHGSCPECDWLIASSLASDEKNRKSRFRRVTFRRLCILLKLHLLAGILYLATFIVPAMVGDSPRSCFQTKTFGAVISFLIFPGLPIAMVLAFTIVILTVANRDRMTKRQLWCLVIATALGFSPMVIVLIQRFVDMIRLLTLLSLPETRFRCVQILNCV